MRNLAGDIKSNEMGQKGRYEHHLSTITANGKWTFGATEVTEYIYSWQSHPPIIMSIDWSSVLLTSRLQHTHTYRRHVSVFPSYCPFNHVIDRPQGTDCSNAVKFPDNVLSATCNYAQISVAGNQFSMLSFPM